MRNENMSNGFRRSNNGSSVAYLIDFDSKITFYFDFHQKIKIEIVCHISLNINMFLNPSKQFQEAFIIISI